MRWFWTIIQHHDAINERLVGFACCSFDLPFLVRRSWALGVPVPATITRPSGRWNDHIVDLLDVWRLNNRDQTISLDGLARFLGVGSKSGKGADFAQLLASDRDAALAYLRHDLKLTAACAAKMGVS
jgi:hypothetical protein